MRDRALAVANVHEDRIAADIGCGTGFITEGLVQRGLSVIAVDGSEAMLSQMKQKFACMNLIDYRLGEAGSLPIQDQTVDYAFANMYLHHVDVPPEAIREMARILKPGGVLVITDLDVHGFEFLRESIRIAGWDFPGIISKGGLRRRGCEILSWIVWARTAVRHPPVDQKKRRSAYSWHRAKNKK